MSDRARRLLELADTALAHADATARAVEDLLAAIAPGSARAAPARPLGGVDVALDSARLVAIEMAVAGRSRQEVGEHVRRFYEVADVEALLDDVFGPVVPAA